MENLENLLNEAKRINAKRLKTLFIFVTLNFICLGLHFITLYKPMLSACFLAVGCYLVYQWKQKAKSFNAESDFLNDEKLKMFFNVENAFFIFFLCSYLLGVARIVSVVIDPMHGGK
ncbi:hypothetical protein HPSA20_1191 [Helicobacter pylori SouthAfrica20]|uniref:Uncharacterized protein n=1 Tax=Helicobacter pylori SouthAfrica20 TaxID=1352356 RepID=T1UAK8_HELPX|nr:hypothetical protein HPSA20_0521 [Helicobacter pylori SouthAfrica20]AGT74411.1 hypothetical protein HPSA20_1191 [Helicobacter pylori SouthAfrica20]